MMVLKFSMEDSNKEVSLFSFHYFPVSSLIDSDFVSQTVGVLQATD